MSEVAVVRASSLPAARRTPSGVFAIAPVVSFASAERVERLVAAWREESRYLSWMDDILACRSARALARIGADAVPQLAKILDRDAEGSVVVMAMLGEILRRGPEIPAEARGDRDAKRTRWRAWLRTEGHL